MNKETPKRPCGRPRVNRNAIAGTQLRQALRLLGKAWRKNTNDPDHICQWKAWGENKLPRSATTIDTDIRLGVPEERLTAYERCLGLPPETLGSEEADIHGLLGTTTGGHESSVFPMLHAWGPSLSKEFLAYNRAEYSKKLLRLLGGVYRIQYILRGVEPIFRCALLVSGSAGRIKGRGAFMMFGMENSFDASIFRWHNNLHFMYLCGNRTEMGHFLTVDPLRHNLVMRRDPFWLRGQGVTDRGLADNTPITFIFQMHKLEHGEASPDELFQAERAALKARPVIEPDEPDYQQLRELIEAPDNLV